MAVETQNAVMTFSESRANFIGEHIELTPPEAAKLTVEAGIIGPLIEYGDDLERMGFTAEDVDKVLLFAELVSEAARKREQDTLDRNPLAQLDLRLIQQINEVSSGDDGSYYKSSQLGLLIRTRATLRELQSNIKNKIKEISSKRNITSPDALEVLIASLPQAEDMEGIFYTQIGSGRLNDHFRFLNACGIPDPIRFFGNIRSEGRYSPSVRNIPMGINGLWGHIQNVSATVGSPDFDYGLTFERGAIRTIAESPDLPPLKSHE